MSKESKQLNKVLEAVFEELLEETIEECEKILPTTRNFRKGIKPKATHEGFTIEFGDEFDSLFSETGESVFVPRGVNPNTNTPYSYSAVTGQHTRRTPKGRVSVRAHTKYYQPGYKPVEGKGGWYTASPNNNFGLQMAALKISRNFLQQAWSKVYRKQPKEIRKELPKVIQIDQV